MGAGGPHQLPVILLILIIIIITGVAPFTYDPFTYHPFYLPVVGKRVADHHHHYRHVSFIFSARPGQAILSPIDWIETILKFRAIRDHLTSFLAFFKKIGNIIFTTQKVSSQSPKFGKKKLFFRALLSNQVSLFLSVRRK